jgi:hypothetical protein
MTGSNRRPPACKAGALPAELIPHLTARYFVAQTAHIPQYVSRLRASYHLPNTLNSSSGFPSDLFMAFLSLKRLWKLAPSQTRRRSATHISDMRALRQQRMTQVITHQMVGLVGLEPTTPALSRRCSNQLSYRPALARPTQQPIGVDAYPTENSLERR